MLEGFLSPPRTLGMAVGFCLCFCCIDIYGHLIFLFRLFLWWKDIHWFPSMEPALHPWNKSHLDITSMFLIRCWRFFVNTWMRLYASVIMRDTGLVGPLCYCLCLCCYVNADLWEWVRTYSLCVCFLEEIGENTTSLNIFWNSSIETSGPGVFDMEIYYLLTYCVVS